MSPGGEAEGVGRRSQAGIRLPVPRTSYAPGHHAHWIQWNRARRDVASQHPATVVEIDDEAFTIQLHGEPVRLYHHDLQRLREIVAHQGTEIVAQTAWAVVWFGTYLIGVSSSGPLGPCPRDQPRGGATVSATTEADTSGRLHRAVARGFVPDAGS